MFWTRKQVAPATVVPHAGYREVREFLVAECAACVADGHVQSAMAIKRALLVLRSRSVPAQEETNELDLRQ